MIQVGQTSPVTDLGGLWITLWKTRSIRNRKTRSIGNRKFVLLGTESLTRTLN